MASALDISEIWLIKDSIVKISGKNPETILLLKVSFTKTPALWDGKIKTQSLKEVLFKRMSSRVSEIKVCINTKDFIKTMYKILSLNLYI